jgi:glycosyltransferase involved in cell wall biosynthesis
VQKYLQQADLVFLLSQKEKDYAIAKLGLSPGRIRIVDNGLPDHFIGRPVDFDRHSGLKLAVIGTFSNRKGTSYVVPSLIHLMDRYEELLVGFFGTNSSDEAVLRHFPQHLLSRIKITAYYDHVSLPDLLQDYKILLMASLAEGYGMVGLEGMASGLALIATEVSGMAERLDNNVNAILIAPGSVPAIEEAVTRFVENPAFLGSIRRAAYAFAQNFSWNKVAEKTVGFYQAAIETRAGETGRQ